MGSKFVIESEIRYLSIFYFRNMIKIEFYLLMLDKREYDTYKNSLENKYTQVK